MGGTVDLFVLLQLPGDGIGSSLLIFAFILAVLVLAAETPHDTPREGYGSRFAVFSFDV